MDDFNLWEPLDSDDDEFEDIIVGAINIEEI